LEAVDFSIHKGRTGRYFRRASIFFHPSIWQSD